MDIGHHKSRFLLNTLKCITLNSMLCPKQTNKKPKTFIQEYQLKS